MLKVGVTGGIGSGKTIVCKCFEHLGIPVYNADHAARKLMNENDFLKQSLISNFGKDVYTTDNYLNSKWLSDKVFNNESALNNLNSIVHPVVAKDYELWIRSNNSAPYTIHEAAILFETGIWKKLDFVILVDAPENVRVNRIKSRDSRSEEAIRTIMAKQWHSEKKRTLAHAIIENDDQHLVLPYVVQLHFKFLNYGS